MHDPDAMQVFPYVRYHARNDSRTRGEHAHLDGRIFRKDDPFLSTHTPPWEFNCRCWLEEITEKEAGKTPDLIQPPTPEDKVTVDSRSGFRFDPAHAFEKFDTSIISDETMRKDTERSIKKLYSEAKFDSEAKYGKMSTNVKSFDDAMKGFGRKAPSEIKEIMRAAPEPKVVFNEKADIASFSNGTIEIGPNSEPKNCVHEWMHYIDATIISRNKSLSDLKNEKLLGILNDISEKIQTDSEMLRNVEGIIADSERRNSVYASTIADLFGAISSNRVGYGHDDLYWARPGNRQSDALSQMLVLYGRQAKEWKKLETIAPELTKCFREIILKISRSLK